MSTPLRPYQTPSADLDHGFGDPRLASNAVAMRNEYLSHEGAVRSIGILYFISSAILTCAIPVGFAMMADNPTFGAGFAGGCALFAALFVWMGVSIRNLNARVRLAVGIFSGVGLLNLPIGTLINGYILFLVFGEKGKVVFSDEYAFARDQTPHIRYQTSRAVKICAVALILLVATLAIFLALGS